MGILNLLFVRWTKAEASHDAADLTGALFGLDPPEGYQFHVSNHRGSSWHVRIVQIGRNECEAIAHECALIGRHPSDEACIKRAAKDALVAAERKLRAEELEGRYPPKRTDA